MEATCEAGGRGAAPVHCCAPAWACAGPRPVLAAARRPAYGREVPAPVVSAIAALALAASTAGPAAHPPAGSGKAPALPESTPLERRRTALAKDLLQVAVQVKREIERGDVGALLARVPPEGLRCGGRLVPRERVEHDLRDPGSWLHGVLFGGPGATAEPGQPASLRALFAGAEEVAVLVSFREDPRAPEGLPCFDYQAKGRVTPGAPLCFEPRGGRYWFSESLYPCP